MKFIINESKFNEIIQDYFKENPELYPLDKVRGWAFDNYNFYPSSSDLGDDDESPDYSFSYYPDEDNYAELNTYEKDEFPLIEMNAYLWDKLSSMFGEKVIETNLLDWINKTYELDAVKIVQG
jgi:hypothetical protein